MDCPDFRRAIADYVRAEAKPPDKYSHQPRLYQLARTLAQGQTFDDDVLYAAAWLHDIGVFIGHRPEDPVQLAEWDNVSYAVARAPDLLKSFDFPTAKIPAVQEAIRTHQPSGNPTSIEGVVLRDADILDQLGAVGICRTLSKVGRDTRYPTFADAVRVLRRTADELPGQLRLPLSKQLGQERSEFIRSFLDALTMEAGVL